MKTIEVYDPAMCCSTGVCGPEVDPALVAFAADLKWLEGQGVDQRREWPEQVIDSPAGADIDQAKRRGRQAARQRGIEKARGQ